MTQGEVMNIPCPKCDTVIQTDVKLKIESTRRADSGGMYVDVDIESIDYEPWREHYATAHA